MPPTRPIHRIAKLLARAGVASRRDVERMIAEGRVAKDGVVLDTPATLLASLDGVTVDGAPVEAPTAARLFLFHKPAGVLTTARDPGGRPTIYDRLPADLPRLVPVGRLDLNTEGLLLLTTDGELKRQLELPSTGVERAYRARAYGQVSQPQLEELIHGIEIEGVRYGAIDANLERRTGANVWIELVLTEGKNREVRRVLEHLGLRVSRLIRTRYGPFVLGDLPVGGVGEVRVADLAAFRHTLNRSGKAASEMPRTSVSRAPRPARDMSARAPRPALGAARSAPGAPRMAEPGARPRPVRAEIARPPRPDARPPQPEGQRQPRADAARPPRGDAPRPRTEAPRSPRSDAPRQQRARDERTETPPEATTRPARPKRQPGWAKPKPRTGPARPRRK